MFDDMPGVGGIERTVVFDKPRRGVAIKVAGQHLVALAAGNPGSHRVRLDADDFRVTSTPQGLH